MRGEENSVVTVQQTIGGRRYVGVKLDVPEVAVFVGSVSLMTDSFQRQVRPTGLVEYIQQPERGESDGDQDHAG